MSGLGFIQRSVGPGLPFEADLRAPAHVLTAVAGTAALNFDGSLAGMGLTYTGFIQRNVGPALPFQADPRAGGQPLFGAISGSAALNFDGTATGYSEAILGFIQRNVGPGLPFQAGPLGGSTIRNDALKGTTSLLFDTTGTGSISGTPPIAQGAQILGFGPAFEFQADLRNSQAVVPITGVLVATGALTFDTTGVLRPPGLLIGTGTLTFDRTGIPTGTGIFAGSSALLFDGHASPVQPPGGLVGTTTITFSVLPGNLTPSEEFMGLQNFINYVGPAISASWLNNVDQAINGQGSTEGAALIPYYDTVTLAQTTVAAALNALQTSLVSLLGGTCLSNIAALRATTPATSGSAYHILMGYTTPGDGGVSFYYYVPSDTTTPDNGSTVIVSADGSRWYIAGSLT